MLMKGGGVSDTQGRDNIIPDQTLTQYQPQKGGYNHYMVITFFKRNIRYKKALLVSHRKHCLQMNRFLIWWFVYVYEI